MALAHDARGWAPVSGSARVRSPRSPDGARPWRHARSLTTRQVGRRHDEGDCPVARLATRWSTFIATTPVWALLRACPPGAARALRRRRGPRRWRRGRQRARTRRTRRRALGRRHRPALGRPRPPPWSDRDGARKQWRRAGRTRAGLPQPPLPRWQRQRPPWRGETTGRRRGRSHRRRRVARRRRRPAGAAHGRAGAPPGAGATRRLTTCLTASAGFARSTDHRDTRSATTDAARRGGQPRG